MAVGSPDPAFPYIRVSTGDNDPPGEYETDNGGVLIVTPRKTDADRAADARKAKARANHTTNMALAGVGVLLGIWFVIIVLLQIAAWSR